MALRWQKRAPGLNLTPSRAARGRQMPDYTLKTFADVAGMSAFAAEQLAQAAARALAERGRVLVALSGGSTPLALFGLLAQPPFKERLPWQAMHFFWADERCVPPQDT